MAPYDKDDFRVTTKETNLGAEPSYPPGPLEGRSPLDNLRFAVAPAPAVVIAAGGPGRAARRPRNPPAAAVVAAATPSTLSADDHHALLWWPHEAGASAKGKLLAAMPIRRAVVVAPGKNAHGIGPDENRSSYKEAGWGYLVGQERVGGQACEKCRGAGKGPFEVCVVVPGFFGEACVSCRYYSHEGHCSLRQ
ncbi:hypothetical protein BGZ57DRAFT_1005240 [Hyaloscypha finlandica]|nr:hypothetical protein BGZ57DRAFT_1005240 [Hyaloscypha finlandica]